VTRRPGAPALGAAILFAAATAALFLTSRGKWCDAIIDAGSEWIVPDVLARGGLLYRDVIHWFGPFTPYWNSLFFRAFGSSFSSLALAGAVSACGVVWVVFLVLRRVAGGRMAAVWAGLAVPALVFMPNSGGAILAMGYRIWHAAGFTLAAALVASSRLRRPALGALAAGCLAGLAGLCRTEWGLAALAGVAVAGLSGGWAGSPRLRLSLAAICGYLATFGGVLVAFVLLAGPKAVLSDGHVLLTGIPPETRTFLLRYSGLGDWRRGVFLLVYSGAMWWGAATAVEALALAGRDVEGQRRRLARLLALVATLAIAGSLLGFTGEVVFSAGPLVSGAALVFGLRRAPRPRAALAAAVGFLGVVLSYRRPFHIGDAAYVAPPLLFAFVSAGFLCALAIARLRRGTLRRRLAWAGSAAGALLVAAAFAARCLEYAHDDRVPIAGTGGMLSSRASEAAEMAEVAAALEGGTPRGGGLVCFPEGQVFNYLTGRSDPIRHNLFIPGYLTKNNESEILAELARRPPAAVLIWSRPAGEYGEGLFGISYGRWIQRWIDENYELPGKPRPGASARVGFRRRPSP
jgi:hypothetical protein